MKKYIPAVSVMMVALMFFACSNEDEVPSGPSTVTLRYELTTADSDSFLVAFSVDTLGGAGSEYSTTIDGNFWSKDTTISKSAVERVTRLVSFAPVSWGGSNLQTAAHVRILVDGVEKSAATGILSGFDRPTGLSVTARY